jgi:plastocyanin
MTRRTRLVITVIVVLGFGSVAAGPSISTASGAAVCGPSWSIVSSPNVGTGPNALTDVAALSPTDAWAVGDFVDEAGVSHTLAEHWDGSQWSVVPTPDGESGMGALAGVAALSSSDVWAVGSSPDGDGRSHTLVLHWDGSGWTVVPSPSPAAYANDLSGVSAASATDIWAVGSQSIYGAGDAQSLALHWDGKTWAVVATIDPSLTNNYLFDVEAISPDDVWAAGSYLKDENLIYQVLYEHWDGSAFARVAGPNAVQESVYGIDAVSSNDVWAVGPGGDPAAPGNPFSHHWDGTAWHDVSIPPMGLGPLNEVAALFPDDVWAVGGTHDLAEPSRTLAENWDGQQWSVVGTPNVGEADNVLTSTAGASGSDQLWAVGDYSDEGGVTRTLAMWICPMPIRDQGFARSHARVAQGMGMAWVIPSSDLGPHSVTDASGMGLFDSGPRASGSSFTYTFPGAGTYRVRDRATADELMVTVPTLASPRRGHLSTPFTVTWATDTAPSDYAFDVQIRRPGTGWQEWLTREVDPSATFTPDAGTGAYSFRARLRYLINGATSGYSAVASITVR